MTSCKGDGSSSSLTEASEIDNGNFLLPFERFWSGQVTGAKRARHHSDGRELELIVVIYCCCSCVLLFVTVWIADVSRKAPERA